MKSLDELLWKQEDKMSGQAKANEIPSENHVDFMPAMCAIVMCCGGGSGVVIRPPYPPIGLNNGGIGC